MTEAVHEARIETKIDNAGRIMFPAYLRKGIGVGFGDKVVIELKDGRLTVYKAQPIDSLELTESESVEQN